MKLPFYDRKKHVEDIFKNADWEFDYQKRIFYLVKDGVVILNYSVLEGVIRVDQTCWRIISRGRPQVSGFIDTMPKDEKAFRKILRNVFDISVTHFYAARAGADLRKDY